MVSLLGQVHTRGPHREACGLLVKDMCFEFAGGLETLGLNGNDTWNMVVNLASYYRQSPNSVSRAALSRRLSRAWPHCPGPEPRA